MKIRNDLTLASVSSTFPVRAPTGPTPSPYLEVVVRAQVRLHGIDEQQHELVVGVQAQCDSQVADALLHQRALVRHVHRVNVTCNQSVKKKRSG